MISRRRFLKLAAAVAGTAIPFLKGASGLAAEATPPAAPVWARGAWVAYRPKGAATYADSFRDLSGNGHHATPGRDVEWSANEGWQFTGANGSIFVQPPIGAFRIYDRALSPRRLSRSSRKWNGWGSRRGNHD